MAPRLTKSQLVLLSSALGAVAVAAGLGSGAAYLLTGGATPPRAPPRALSASELTEVAQSAFHEGSARPDGRRTYSVPVQVRPGDTLSGAIQRAGVPVDEARAAVQALAAQMDVLHIKAGMSLQADIARRSGGLAPAAQLVGLSLRAGPAKVVSLAEDGAGGFRLRSFEEKVAQETAVAAGPISGSLYEAALHAGADAKTVVEAARLFSHKIDFSRDLHPEDHFKLVFDRKMTESGRTIETGELMYAELESKGKATRFYRFRHDGRPQYFDELGKNIKGFLLRTPVDAVRITSGFGMRFHPILGYNRMHQGIDFGASTGTPVYAAGDGVVQEIKWAGGYGHWLKLKHNGGWATGYGHLSAYARGLRVGQHVAQGQVIAYVGSTGVSTGPHLHYEVMNGAAKLDPKSARVPQGTVLGGRELAAFKAEKAHIEALIASASRRSSGSVQTARVGSGPVASPGASGGGGL